jgi:hypothetical protein
MRNQNLAYVIEEIKWRVGLEERKAEVEPGSFDVYVDESLLHPTFHVYEVRGGEVIGDIFCFDIRRNISYVRGERRYYTVDDVMRLIKFNIALKLYPELIGEI